MEYLKLPVIGLTYPIRYVPDIILPDIKEHKKDGR